MHSDLIQSKIFHLQNVEGIKLNYRGTNRKNFLDLPGIVDVSANDEQTIQKINRNSMRGQNLCPSNFADSSVGGEDDDGSQSGLQGAVEVCETFDVKHVHLIYKQNARNKLGNALVDVSVDDFVDFFTKLFGDLGLSRLHHVPKGYREQ